MNSDAITFGRFLSDLMERRKHTNRSLAAAAGVSEGAVRNMLKLGVESSAKDPDPRTLRRIAEALGVNPLRLYRLAGYLPTTPDAHSVRAEFVADVFDRLPTDKQEAVLGVLDVMANDPQVHTRVEVMRDNAKSPLAGFDFVDRGFVRTAANLLIAQYDMTEAVDISRIEPDVKITHRTWRELPTDTQERVKALIRHKLSLDYEPTMVDEEWRR